MNVPDLKILLSKRTGVKLVDQGAKSKSECWHLFINHTYTNLHIRERKASCVDLSKCKYIG